MRKSILFILSLLISCTPTESLDTHDDISVLQDIIFNSNLAIKPLDLGEQIWNENGRIIMLNCDSTGLRGEIPESIGNLTELKQLGLKNNNLSGNIPESIGNLLKLKQLNLAHNALNGSIPYTIGNLKSLTNLVLSNNLFTGSIPISIGKLSILHTFFADSNNFSGTIPDDICTIYPNLIDYDLSSNRFCPPLPDCLDTPDEIGFQNCDTSCGTGYEYLYGYCYAQRDLNVLQTMINNNDSLNMIWDIDSSEVIEPLELGFQEWSAGRLESLDCYWNTISCNLSTSIPDNMGDLDSLKFIDLQKNNLSGSFPEFIGDIHNLTTLNITDNQFTGYLPDNICNISSVFLNENMFCPCYPECISNNIAAQDTSDCSVCDEGYSLTCNELNENHVGKNNINHQNFSNFVEESLCFNQSDLNILQTFIDSSSSTLDIDIMDLDSSGFIEPLELGNQVWLDGELISLNVSHLELSGGISDSIGHLNNLTNLHIHENKLSGYIPNVICTLAKLTWADDSTAVSNSLLYNNEFCPPYPDCIAPYIGEQNTTECPTSE